MSKTRLFDKIVKDSDGAKKDLNVKLQERSIKREFQAASDDLDAQTDAAQIKYNNHLSNLDGFDVNSIIKQKQFIKDADATKVLLQDAYKDLFSEDLA
jgi:hypothetical protein